MPIRVTRVKKGPGGHTSYEFEVIGKCKGDCGQTLTASDSGLYPENPPYKEGYCKDCYIAKLEQDVERLKEQIAYQTKISVPPAIY